MITELAENNVPAWSGRELNADNFVANRDALADAQRLAADLAAAPKEDRDLLTAEQARLTALQAAVDASNAAVVAARDGIVDARVAGESDHSARAVAERADVTVADVTRELKLQTQIVTKLHDRILAAVRAEQAAKAQAHLDEARELWRAALARLVPAYDAIAALGEAHELEKKGADELAFARLEYRHKFDEAGFRARTGPEGAPYVTTPEPNIVIVLDGEPILTAAELVARLGRI